MKIKSNYKNSEKTKEMVKVQIRERWGEEESKKYNPMENCFPFRSWLDAGYIIKKGEKALKSINYIAVRDTNGEVISTFAKTINLFYYLQVEKVNA